MRLGIVLNDFVPLERKQIIFFVPKSVRDTHLQTFHMLLYCLITEKSNLTPQVWRVSTFPKKRGGSLIFCFEIRWYVFLNNSLRNKDWQDWIFGILGDLGRTVKNRSVSSCKASLLSIFVLPFRNFPVISSVTPLESCVRSSTVLLDLGLWAWFLSIHLTRAKDNMCKALNMVVFAWWIAAKF